MMAERVNDGIVQCPFCSKRIRIHETDCSEWFIICPSCKLQIIKDYELSSRHCMLITVGDVYLQWPTIYESIIIGRINEKHYIEKFSNGKCTGNTISEIDYLNCICGFIKHDLVKYKRVSQNQIKRRKTGDLTVVCDGSGSEIGVYWDNNKCVEFQWDSSLEGNNASSSLKKLLKEPYYNKSNLIHHAFFQYVSADIKKSVSGDNRWF